MVCIDVDFSSPLQPKFNCPTRFPIFEFMLVFSTYICPIFPYFLFVRKYICLNTSDLVQGLSGSLNVKSMQQLESPCFIYHSYSIVICALILIWHFPNYKRFEHTLISDLNLTFRGQPMPHLKVQMNSPVSISVQLQYMP